MTESRFGPQEVDPQKDPWYVRWFEVFIGALLISIAFVKDAFGGDEDDNVGNEDRDDDLECHRMPSSPPQEPHEPNRAA